MSILVCTEKPIPGYGIPVRLGLPVRCLQAGHQEASPQDLDRMTEPARQMLPRIDEVPGVNKVYATRHRIHVIVAPAFDTDTVTRDVLAVIADVTGLEVAGQ